MARQRNFATEYARRSKTVIAETRARTAKAAGFETYSKYRRADEKITKEFTALKRRDIWDQPIPEPKSPLRLAMLQAEAVIRGYSPEQRKRSAKKRESLLGRTKEGREIRSRLRKLLGYDDKNWPLYYPTMRMLY